MKPLITQTRRHNLAIEVTYDCNIKCQNCNRYCPEAPGGVESYMSLEQINHFVQETYTMNHFWTVVKIAGGEPMMHIHIMDIVKYFSITPTQMKELVEDKKIELTVEELNSISTVKQKTTFDAFTPEEAKGQNFVNS